MINNSCVVGRVWTVRRRFDIRRTPSLSAQQMDSAAHTWWHASWSHWLRQD